MNLYKEILILIAKEKSIPIRTLHNTCLPLVPNYKEVHSEVDYFIKVLRKINVAVSQLIIDKLVTRTNRGGGYVIIQRNSDIHE